LLECASPQSDNPRLYSLLRKLPEWAMLLRLADEHGLLVLLATRLQGCEESLLPSDVRSTLQSRLRAQLLFTLSMAAELFHVLEIFAAAGIEALPVKGPVLSVRAYGDPGLRQYMDLDLLVRHRDILRTSEVMIAAGYEPDVPLRLIQAGKIPGQYLFRRPSTKLLIELHTEHTLRYFPRAMPVEKLFERETRVVVDSREVPALAIEDELVLNCIHGAKHLWERLMWIADVAAMVSRQTNIDWERTTQAARDVGAERMLHVGLRLAAEMLKTQLPEKIADAVRNDAAAGRLAQQIRRWLPQAGYAPPSLFERAAFRIRMRGGILPGTAYLLRLSLFPTEEDWVEGVEEQRSWLLDGLRRPFRLAHKYGRGRKS
jgi:hypothetical protein